MNSYPMTQVNLNKSRLQLLLIIASFLCGTFAIAGVAQGQVDGFTEPFRQIELASDETGSISTLEFAEGEIVQKDDIVAALDNRLQALQLEIAKHMADATSQLHAAEQTLKKREAISARLSQLKKRGHASESEIIRADLELSIAQAKYLAAKEELVVREIEKKRAEIELERRNIRAPFTGVVAKILRREGEFLSPLHPEVVSLIQVDQLLANFAVPSSQVQIFEIGKTFEVEIVGGATVQATVHSIGVQTDAQSGTIEVKLLIDNKDLAIRAGEICTLNI